MHHATWLVSVCLSLCPVANLEGDEGIRLPLPLWTMDWSCHGIPGKWAQYSIMATPSLVITSYIDASIIIFLCSEMSCKDNTKSQGWRSVGMKSSTLNVNKPVPVTFFLLTLCKHRCQRVTKWWRHKMNGHTGVLLPILFTFLFTWKTSQKRFKLTTLIHR